MESAVEAENNCSSCFCLKGKILEGNKLIPGE
jgi:hypothetical protein